MEKNDFLHTVEERTEPPTAQANDSTTGLSTTQATDSTTGLSTTQATDSTTKKTMTTTAELPAIQATDLTTKMTTTELPTTQTNDSTTAEQQIMSTVDALTSGEIVGIAFAIAAVISFVIILIILGVCIFRCIGKKHCHKKVSFWYFSITNLAQIFQIIQPQSYLPLDDINETISKPDCWELLPSDIIMGDLLGEGAFGEVYKGFLTGKLDNAKVNHLHRTKANIAVAVKILNGTV